MVTLPLHTARRREITPRPSKQLLQGQFLPRWAPSTCQEPAPEHDAGMAADSEAGGLHLPFVKREGIEGMLILWFGRVRSIRVAACVSRFGPADMGGVTRIWNSET